MAPAVPEAFTTAVAQLPALGPQQVLAQIQHPKLLRATQTSVSRTALSQTGAHGAHVTQIVRQAPRRAAEVLWNIRVQTEQPVLL